MIFDKKLALSNWGRVHILLLPAVQLIWVIDTHHYPLTAIVLQVSSPGVSMSFVKSSLQNFRFLEVVIATHLGFSQVDI
jgi:hypothetical protein